MDDTITTIDANPKFSFSYHKMKKQAGLWLLLTFLFPILACNLPVGPAPAVENAVESTMTSVDTQAEQGSLPTNSLNPVPSPSAAPDLATAIPELLPDPVSELVGGVFHYYTQPGDWPEALELRFGVAPGTLLNPYEFPPQAMLPPGTKLQISNLLGAVEILPALMQDSEVIYSPAASDFSTVEFVRSAGGYLSQYSENIDGEMLNGAQIVERVALETSINPRLLLAFLEYRSGWLRGQPAEQAQYTYPIGFYAGEYRGLYKELILTARQLTIGYYGWRSGKIVYLDFVGGTRQRMNPLLNPGTAALQTLFSKLYNPENWKRELYSPGRFVQFYRELFPDSWANSVAAGPVLPAGLKQPFLALPFQIGETWSFTGGPHAAWGVGSPWGGLDFAPAAVEKGCTVSRFWATAAAGGTVTRSERGVVAIDLDGDGFEGSGWVLVYLHIAAIDRVPSGSMVQVDQPIGHPSCEGGNSTGTHLHLSRKYNGEWMGADGPVPFILSGWQAWPGDVAYSGTLVRGDNIVTARPDGSHTSLITR